MASVNDMKEKILQNNSPRQKIIIVAMVVVVLIVIWQIVGLFGEGGGAPTPAPTKPQSRMSASSPDQAAAPTKNGMAASASPNAPSATQVQVTDNISQASIVNDSQFMKMQRLTEEKYMGKLNELEELRIQRQIAETNQAIAAAKLATVSAEKDISELLTKPATPLVPISDYANQLVRPSASSVDLNSTGTATPSTQPAVATVQSEAPLSYALISVSMQLNRWNAIVGFQGTLYSVGVGDILPPDGSVVTHINKNSVVLRKDGRTRKISITASI